MDYYYEQDYDEGQMEYDETDYLDDEGSVSWSNKEDLVTVARICLLPSLIQISNYVMLLLGWSLVYRFVCHITFSLKLKSDLVQHLSSIIIGLACLFCALEWQVLIILFLSVAAYILMLLVEYYNLKNFGLIIAICTISSHFLYEGFWKVPDTWQRLRGTQMVVSMKVISLAFDLESVGNKKKPAPIPGVLPFLGYIFCPPTSVLGPWIPYSVYLRSFLPSGKGSWKWVFWSLSNLLTALAFLCLSNCLYFLWLTDHSLKWLITIRDAFSVRCSHYFISFLSQAALATGNINLRSGEIPNAIYGHMITKPWHIEFPQSLSFAIRNWNIPMHKWLKTYVFQSSFAQTKKYLVAIVLTYLVSSLLHGMHFRIYLVLMSLGLFAYVENVFRKKLAEIFNACITGNKCKKPCQYEYCRSRSLTTSSSLLVIFVNFCFGLLAAFHLAYLGVMLNNSGAESEDLMISPGLKKWSDLDYLCHIITICIYLFYRVI